MAPQLRARPVQILPVGCGPTLCELVDLADSAAAAIRTMQDLFHEHAQKVQAGESTPQELRDYEVAAKRATKEDPAHSIRSRES